MARRPEDTAALVNGLIVLLLPVGLIAAVAAAIVASNEAVHTGTAGLQSKLSMMAAAQMVLTTGAVVLPFAALAAWRTWVHAKRQQSGRGRGWQGVLEGGATGFAGAILYFAPGIVTRPAEAPPYIIFYGGAAMIVGLLVGTLLRMTALLVLRIKKPSVA